MSAAHAVTTRGVMTREVMAREVMARRRLPAAALALACLAGCGGEAEVPLDAAPRAIGAASPAPAAPPRLLRVPQPLVTREGEGALFVAAADGAPPLAWQWLCNGVEIAGARGPVLQLAAALRGDDGARYAVRVSNAAGAVQSPPAQLRVEPAGTRAPWE
jgi:hypothetical protein